ncbi:MAG: ATP-dependent sacrificial sulfur transferase LarE [Verrucomicrobiales bacterium]
MALLLSETILKKQQRLYTILQEHAPLLIAYSGGVDSAYLMAAAAECLSAEQFQGLIADSPSLPRRALADAQALAQERGWPLQVVETHELADPRYVENRMDRCFFCKAELFSVMENQAQRQGYVRLAYGENADDQRMIRPGSEAARQLQVLAPLREANLSKQEIRLLSQSLQLPTADHHAQPCLSSRILQGVPVTSHALGMVEQGEEILREAGFALRRVRHSHAPPRLPEALLQVGADEVSRLLRMKSDLLPRFRALGYGAVEVDEQGYQAPRKLSNPDEARAASLANLRVRGL